MTQIRLAIAGVGNCASSLVQGIFHYGDESDAVGLMHGTLGGYAVSDLEPVCAFDVDERKTGTDLGQALFSEPNCTERFADVPEEVGAPVYRGPSIDGVAEHTQDHDESGRIVVDTESEAVDVAEKLQDHDVDVLVCYLPVGATDAVEYYANAALEAGVGFVNAIPEFIASDADWAARFEEAGLPVVGDDIKSQLGATITHRSLVQLFADRGVELRNTYQLNVGGNTDFLNMLDRSRLDNKKTSKTAAVNDLLDEPLDPENIHIGPSDYVEFLDDQKTAFLHMEGEKFGGAEVELDVRLRVKDSPNSAGSAVDAIRCAKIALDRGVGGALLGPSAFTMKHPPQQLTDEEAKRRMEAFAAPRDD